MSKRFSDSFNSIDKPRKRRSRWQDCEEERKVLAGLPTVIPGGLTKEQEDQYLLQLQVEEITRRLRTGELGIPSNIDDRSPSPEPIYSTDGKRLNTREFRTRKKLEEDRHHLIQQVLKDNPEYKPPFDYRPMNVRICERVMIPQDENPAINFVGLLIGPRGNTLKNLEKETGTNIIIRGKGSVKEGKVGMKDGRPLPGQDEPLHAYITATNPEFVKKAVDLIKSIIKEGIAVPDADNDLRKQQLRELALLNGTLRDTDALSKLKQLQQAQTIITNTILCTTCGGAGHIAMDCKQKRPSETLKTQLYQGNMNMMQNMHEKAKMDIEYMSLMAELGEAAPDSNQHNHHNSNFVPHSINSSHSYSAPRPALTYPPWQAGAPPGIPPTGPPPTVPPSNPLPPPPSLRLPPVSLPPPVMPPWQRSERPPGNWSMPSANLGSLPMLPPPSIPPPPIRPPTSSMPLPPWSQNLTTNYQNSGNYSINNITNSNGQYNSTNSERSGVSQYNNAPPYYNSSRGYSNSNSGMPFRGRPQFPPRGPRPMPNFNGHMRPRY